MTKIILSGCLGRMGKAITEILKNTDDAQIVCGFDIASGECDYPIYNSYEDVDVDADVIIDFSHPSNFSSVLNFAKKKMLPIVLATTGLSEEQKQEMKEASKEIPVFFSANMSLGINLLIKLAQMATKVLEKDFDIEIVEKHHNKKLDAPSGTALAIADAIDEVMTDDANYVYERQSVRKQREKRDIGIHAIRGGTIVGEHDVIFAGPDEVITLSHHAASREVFAQGAVKAGMFMKGKPAGFYTMNDLFE